jgi:hypothetical protein
MVLPVENHKRRVGWGRGEGIKKAALLDMNKLRMTGFECFDVFVIRCAKHT